MTAKSIQTVLVAAAAVALLGCGVGASVARHPRPPVTRTAIDLGRHAAPSRIQPDESDAAAVWSRPNDPGLGGWQTGRYASLEVRARKEDGSGVATAILAVDGQS